MGREHIMVTHEGKRFQCELCDFTSKTSRHLHNHNRVKHQGIRYKCDKCNYSAKRQDDLKKHVDSIHMGIRYVCEHCGFSITRKGALIKHLKNKHNIEMSVTDSFKTISTDNAEQYSKSDKKQLSRLSIEKLKHYG